ASPGCCWITSSSGKLPASRSLRPLFPSQFVFWLIVGRRISASSNRTRLSCTPNDMAKLYAVVDFPSPLKGLVTRMTCGVRSTFDNKIEVLMFRYDSAISDFGEVSNHAVSDPRVTGACISTLDFI